MLRIAKLTAAALSIQGHAEIMQHFLSGTGLDITETMTSLELLGRCNLIEREIETLRATLSEREHVHHHRELSR